MFTILVLLAAMVTANAGEFRSQMAIGAGSFSLLNGIDKGSVPAAVVAEGNNPTITNPHSGHSFNVSQIGKFDATDISADGDNFLTSELMWRLMIDVSLDKPSAAYARANINLNKYSSISGSVGEGYAYDKVLGGGVDYVRYIYGAKVKPSIISPEIGWRWAGEGEKDKYSFSNADKEIGIEWIPRSVTFYKGIEAYGKPEGLIELGQINDNLILLNARISFQKNGTVGLSVPLSGGNGFGIFIEGRFDYLKQKN